MKSNDPLLESFIEKVCRMEMTAKQAIEEYFTMKDRDKSQSFLKNIH